MRILTFYNAYIGRSIAVLAGIVALSVFLYGALLLGAVAHAAGRTQAEKSVRALSALGFFWAGGLLWGAVPHAAGRTQAEKSVRALSAQVGTLESSYLAQTRVISPALAAAKGFVAPVAVTSVYADIHTGLTLR